MQAAVGVGLVAWVVVVAVTAEVGNPSVLVAAAVSAGWCACARWPGVVLTRVAGAATAARLRAAFVVLEGASLAVFYPFYWAVFTVAPVTGTGDVAVGVVLLLAAPVVVALWLTTRTSQLVHNVVVEADGPLVPGTGGGAPTQRIRVLGTVLVTAGSALSVAVVAVAFTAARYQEVHLISGLAVTVTPVLLGVLLTRVRDVYSARRRNVGSYLAVAGACGIAAATFGFGVGVSGVLIAAVMFGGIVLVVIAYLMVREYTGAWDRPWQERTRGRVSR
ncbi:hypothetical protein BBK82_03825 [Lentzea guizhouensis]|uniref:Uncharacterized protein n=1 Tax=Lentzea guizhouensis TaxID=1586287 RepID=A0A1B2HCA6_9PSEU|nr:hypothetical protein BBK82_03825 [Lentzea guizhouensis]